MPVKSPPCPLVSVLAASALAATFSIFGAARPLPAADSLRLAVRESYLPGIPILVRVEALEASGEPDRSLWDGVAVLGVSAGSVSLSPDRVTLRNGLGSALVTVMGTGDFDLTATLGGLEAARSLRSLAGEPVTTVSSNPAGPVAEWSGVVFVTANITVPAGTTLRVQPGALILLDGVASGTGGTDIRVEGAIESLGTAAEPVTFTSSDPDLAWGQIEHASAAPSSYSYTEITRGGRAPGEGHTGSGPVIRPRSSTLVFEHASITDHAGKIMQASGSDLTFRHTLFSRAVMGPEIDGTAILMEDSYSMEMIGPDDNDGIYLHDQQAGQEITLRRCVVARMTDDGIDTLGSEVTIEDCIVRDIADKGVSVFHNEVHISRAIIVASGIGVSAKTDNGRTVTVNLDRSTIVSMTPTAEEAVPIGIQSENKSNQPTAIIRFNVTSSIIWGMDPIKNDYPANPERLAITYTDVGAPETWPGTGNLSAPPMFIDLAGDFRLEAVSPCIDAGDPVDFPDPDGTRADQGALPFFQSGKEQRFARGRVNGDALIDISDSVALIFHLFLDAPAACESAADADDNDILDLADVLYGLNFLFQGGLAFAAPFPGCGMDPAPSGLGCADPGCP
jgi:hypothetical protein